jgi:hypothetical protein
MGHRGNPGECEEQSRGDDQRADQAAADSDGM